MKFAVFAALVVFPLEINPKELGYSVQTQAFEGWLIEEATLRSPPTGQSHPLHLVRAGIGISLVPRSAMRLKVPGVRFHELGWKEPLWHIGIAWNRNSEKLLLISRFVKVVQAVAGDQEV